MMFQWASEIELERDEDQEEEGNREHYGKVCSKGEEDMSDCIEVVVEAEGRARRGRRGGKKHR